MHNDIESQTSSLVSNERQLVVHLLLIATLAGDEHQVVVDLQEFDRLDKFKTAVLEQLPIIGGLLPSLRDWLPPCLSILMTFASLVAYFRLSACGLYLA